MSNVYAIPEIVHWIGDGQMMPGDNASGQSWQPLTSITSQQSSTANFLPVHLTRGLNGSSQNFPDTGTQTKGGDVWT